MQGGIRARANSDGASISEKVLHAAPGKRARHGAISDAW